MKMRQINYSEGTCFAVPLRDGGIARGIVSRFDGEGVVLGYFYGPRLPSEIEYFHDFKPKPETAILSGLFGHPGLQDGTWRLLGTLPGWSRNDWPLPTFYRKVDEKIIITEYTENLTFIKEKTLVNKTAPANACGDSLMGYGFVEIRLTKLLAN